MTKEEFPHYHTNLSDVVSENNSRFALPQNELEQRLEQEVQKMLDAGPLRPGYHASGIVDVYGSGGWPDDDDIGEVLDYFQNPSDTVVTLLQALP